jgi:hypothetical protein
VIEMALTKSDEIFPADKTPHLIELPNAVAVFADKIIFIPF